LRCDGERRGERRGRERRERKREKRKRDQNKTNKPKRETAQSRLKNTHASASVSATTETDAY
jgi:hypothetical protein